MQSDDLEDENPTAPAESSFGENYQPILQQTQSPASPSTSTPEPAQVPTVKEPSPQPVLKIPSTNSPSSATGLAKDTSPTEEPTKEQEEEKKLKKELESESEQHDKNKEITDASKLKIKPTPEAVKQEPCSPEPAIRKTKFEDDAKRWKSSLIRTTQLQGAQLINDEDYLVNRESYKISREGEFATGAHSKLFNCKKEGTDLMMKVTPLKNINLRYKNNLIKNAIIIMRYLMENQHPSLVMHFAFFQSPNKMYIFMEPLGKINLNTFIKRQRKPTSSTYLQKVKKYGRDVAEGMNHLSVLGIAHNNINTHNVCLTADQTNAKIVGFNSSTLVYDPIKGEEILLPKYHEWNYIHAPETQKGPFRCLISDVWSLGILITCMLCGKPPFPKDVQRVETRLKAHLHRHFVQPEQTLLNLLLKCFEKNPEKRIEIASILLHPYFN